jgi:hypothetical protein
MGATIYERSIGGEHDVREDGLDALGELAVKIVPFVEI